MSMTDDAANGRRADRSVVGRIVLAREAPVRIGPLVIDPTRRRVAHDDGRETFLEPRVMQVLVALAKAGGAIPGPRRRTAERPAGATSWWGEDALSRVIGRLRRLSEDLARDVFDLETLIKVGYRLVTTAASDAHPGASEPDTTPAAPREGANPPLPARPSIAVLSFKNLGPNDDKEYLADAIAEDIITALSRWRWFLVIAARFELRLQGPARSISAGSASSSASATFCPAGCGPPGRTCGSPPNWSTPSTDPRCGPNASTSTLVDVLTLQDEITEHIAAAIEPAMLRDEGVRVARKSVAGTSGQPGLFLPGHVVA